VKPLSFREKKMLERAKYLLVSELATVRNTTEETVEGNIVRAPAVLQALTAVGKRLGKTCARPGSAAVPTNGFAFTLWKRSLAWFPTYLTSNARFWESSRCTPKLQLCT
jgi:hypothetical protein